MSQVIAGKDRTVAAQAVGTPARCRFTVARVLRTLSFPDVAATQLLPPDFLKVVGLQTWTGFAGQSPAKKRPAFSEAL